LACSARHVFGFRGSACAYLQGFNNTWFFPQPAKKQLPRAGNLSIYAASWITTLDGFFPMLWSPDDTSVNANDVTDAYLSTASA
jgi:hypothetical protein